MLFEIMGSDRVWGPVIASTFLFFCVVGPVALLIPLIAWLVMRQRSGDQRRSVELPPPGGEP
jgi:hypothetical protein